MKKQSNLMIRFIVYIVGFLIMTLGIAISVKSNLGVSPVSSIPYTMTCVWGIEMGIATIIFHCGLVLIQVLLLRRNFKLKNLLQIPVGVLFGFFTSFCNYLVTFLPNPGNPAIQLIMMLISTFLLAFGIFLYVPADIVPLAGEGTMLAVSEVFGFRFANVKLAFDISMVAISTLVCLTQLHALGSVGIGTIIAAVLVGTELKLITARLGTVRDRILRGENASEEKEITPLRQIMKTDIYSLPGSMNLQDALRFLTEHKISGAPVVDTQEKLIGFLSDGDILRYLSSEQSLFVNDHDLQKVTFNQKLMGMMEHKVADVAHHNVITIPVDADLNTVCTLLSDYHLKKAPVMENGQMIGVINASNVTKYVLKLMDV